MLKRKFRPSITTAAALAGIVIGIAAPAFAAERDVFIENKLDGWSSASWSDGDSDDETRVTTYYCSREFRARIRKERAGVLPDVTVGSEWIDCRSYDDAVRSDGTPAAGSYHFDINGMDGSCFCDYRTTADTRVFW